MVLQGPQWDRRGTKAFGLVWFGLVWFGFTLAPYDFTSPSRRDLSRSLLCRRYVFDCRPSFSFYPASYPRPWCVCRGHCPVIAPSCAFYLYLLPSPSVFYPSLAPFVAYFPPACTPYSAAPPVWPVHTFHLLIPPALQQIVSVAPSFVLVLATIPPIFSWAMPPEQQIPSIPSRSFMYVHALVYSMLPWLPPEPSLPPSIFPPPYNVS